MLEGPEARQSAGGWGWRQVAGRANARAGLTLTMPYGVCVHVCVCVCVSEDFASRCGRGLVGRGGRGGAETGRGGAETGMLIGGNVWMVAFWVTVGDGVG